MKIRIKYSKLGNLKFIGHLDVMRYFQKEIRRAKLDISYSKGYSPHQIISFAAPLALGITSDGEYFDAEFNSVTTSAEMIEALNAVSVDEIHVTKCVQIPENAKNAMSIVAASDYEITFREQNDLSEKLLASVEELNKAFLSMNQYPATHLRSRFGTYYILNIPLHICFSTVLDTEAFCHPNYIYHSLS